MGLLWPHPIAVDNLTPNSEGGSDKSRPVDTKSGTEPGRRHGIAGWAGKIRSGTQLTSVEEKVNCV